MKYFTILSLLLFCVSASAHDRIHGIYFDSRLSSAHYGILSKDLKVLEELEISEDNGKNLVKLMKLQNQSATSLVDWLKARVFAIIPPGINNQVFVALRSYKFPSPDTISSSDKLPTGGSAGAGTYMENLGAVQYAVGKKIGALMGLKVRGYGNAYFSTPRVGVVSAGANLFLPETYVAAKALKGMKNKKIMKSVVENFVFSLFRLSILLHEGRHGDGNGESLGFFHSLCPSGHDYEGSKACDNNLNGPYSIQAAFIQANLLSCADCSAGQKEFLSVVYADALSRVLTGDTVNEWDDTVEGNFIE